MNKFDKVREIIIDYDGELSDDLLLYDFITSCEETENIYDKLIKDLESGYVASSLIGIDITKKYNELVKDVKRYFELFYQSKSRDSKEQIEQSMLFDKLSKVGVSND